MNRAEKRLWNLLRDRRFGGLKFRRQHPIGPYTADFYCARAMLVVELDGAIHQTARERDVVRDAYMRGLGIRVCRNDGGMLYRDPGLVLHVVGKVIAEQFVALGRPWPPESA
jgi:very-short-patch-repair endonuclease